MNTKDSDDVKRLERFIGECWILNAETKGFLRSIAARLSELEAAQKPIAVSERLPEVGDLVHVWCQPTESFEGLWTIAVLSADRKTWHQWFIRDAEWDEYSCDGHGYAFSVEEGFITHWFPMLPAPPAALSPAPEKGNQE